MKKRVILILFLLIILISTMSFASYSTVTMEVVEEPICTIDIGENSKFEKKLISKDLNNKEVTLQLQVTNNEETLKPTGEIILVLDNSLSMEEKTSNGEIRKDLVFESAKTLVNNLLDGNDKLNIGIVSFSTNVDSSKEATIEDAKLVSTLSNDVNTLVNSISNIEANGPRTDLQAGIQLAKQQFTSNDNNKYIIVLTDGVPNVAIGSNNPYYSDTTITQTKNELLSLAESNINLITMLTGINNEDEYPSSISKTYGQIINEIFGSQESATAGKFYYITDDQIEATITNDIYNDLLPISQSIRDIQIVDYFPVEIIQNFEFAYVTDANIGNISASVDTTNNSITWTIPELKTGETATVQYKLKLKEDFDSSIVDKILNTNQKVDISYKDFNDETQTKTSDISPKLKLTEPPAVLPKAGTTLLLGFIILATGLLIFSITKLTILNHRIK